MNQSKSLEEIYQEHLDSKPTKQYSKFFKDINTGIETNEYITWKIKEKILSSAVEIPKEKRQEILDTFKTGLSVGEVAKKFEVKSEDAGTILYYNITNVSILREDSI